VREAGADREVSVATYADQKALAVGTAVPPPSRRRKSGCLASKRVATSRPTPAGKEPAAAGRRDELTLLLTIATAETPADSGTSTAK
jgi:hypothetical protein